MKKYFCDMCRAELTERESMIDGKFEFSKLGRSTAEDKLTYINEKGHKPDLCYDCLVKELKHYLKQDGETLLNYRCF